MKQTKKKKVGFAVGGLLALTSAFAIGLNVNSFAAVAEDSAVRMVASYFEASDGVTFATNVETPSYVAQNRNGVLVDSPNGGTFTYDNLIDVSDLTRERLLFEMQITPQVAGSYELNQFIIRLEDAEDSRVYVNISLHNYLYGDGGLHGVLSQMTVKTNTVETYRSVKYTNNFNTDKQTDNVTTSLKTGIKQGTELYAPMAGNKGGHSESVCIYYDNVENAIYTVNDNVYTPKTDADPSAKRNVLTNSGLADSKGHFLVIDLDEHKHMGTLKSNLFTGFPSGKAKLSVTTNDVVAESARYTVLTIDGQTFDGMYLNDVTAPALTVDLQGYVAEELPIAVVGKEYPLFSASAVDKMYGNVEVNCVITRGNDTVYYTGKNFVPQTAGEYELRYEASDGNGNKSQRLYRVVATQDVSMSGMLVVQKDEYDFTDNNNVNAAGNFVTNLYYPVKLPQMQAIGGSGNVTVDKKVTFGGVEVDITKDVFVPEKKGVYMVNYQLRDYLGNVTTYAYRLETVYSDVPDLIEPNIPSHILIGKTTLLPAVNAKVYTPWKQEIAAYNKIVIYKADGQTVLAQFDGSDDVAYTPQATDGERVIIEYSTAKDAESQAVVYRKEVDLKASEKLSDRFVLNGATVTEDMSSLIFAFTEENQTVEYLNPLSVYDGLIVKFVVSQVSNGFQEVQFTFTDSLDANVTLTVNVYKNANTSATTSLIAVNGKNAGEINSSFYGNVIDPFQFTLMKDGKIYNYNDDVLSYAENFEGFTSGLVYLSITVKGIESESAVQLNELANQIMGDTNEDYMNPIVNVLEQPVGWAKLGDEVRIGAAVASDVFDAKVSLQVTVTFNGKEVFSNYSEYGKFAGAAFYATDYGKYTLTYVAIDEAGNVSSRMYNIDIVDTIAPKIIINGEIPTSATVGESLSMPKAQAIDNVDVGLTVYIVIIDPMNVFNVIEQGENYVIPHKGRYIVKYYVEDGRCNTTYSQSYTIYAK